MATEDTVTEEIPVDPPSTTRKQIWLDGLWHNNPALVQLLGLCPLLAVSNTLVNGLGLGIATLIVVTLSSILISSMKAWVPTDLRIPLYVLIIASLVSLIDITTQAFWFELHQTLGLFIPLIVTNCLILGRAESFASRNTVADAARDGLAMGLGFLFVLALLGGMREAMGSGTLFANAHTLFGAGATDWTITLPIAEGMIIMLLPPGGFICMGLLLAALNLLQGKTR